MRVCTKCGASEETTKFYKGMYICAPCDNKRRMKRYYENVEEEIARAYAYAKRTGFMHTKLWMKNNKEKYNAAQKVRNRRANAKKIGKNK